VKSRWSGVSTQEKTLRELHQKVLKVAERMSVDEKKMIKEIVESSPNSIMYLGYILVHLRGSFET